MKPLAAEREQVRNVLSRIVGRLGDKHEIAGFGTLANTAPSVSTSYDKDRVQAVINDLLAAGLFEWAQKLVLCERTTSRAGSLRITREKKR